MQNIPVGVAVVCTDGPGGQSAAVIVDPVARKASHIVVDAAALPSPAERVVPVAQVLETSPELIRLRCSVDELAEMEPFISRHYVPKPQPDYSMYQSGEWQAPYSTAAVAQTMLVDEERIPPGELAVHREDRVAATDGHVGTLQEFLVDPDSGEITHLVVEEAHPWGKRILTLPVSSIDSLHERTIQLNLDLRAVRSLPAIPIKRHFATDDSQRGQFELVAYIFDTIDGADATLQLLESQVSSGSDAITIYQAAILTRQEDGEASVTDVGDISAGKSRLAGAVAGGLAGLLAGPAGAILGAAVGAGVGNLASKRIDRGFSDDFLAGIRQHLRSGSSALLVVTGRDQVDSLSGLVAVSKGIIVQQTLDAEGLDRLLSTELQ